MHHNDHEWQRKRVREWTAEASYSSSTKGHTSEIGSEDGQPRLSPAPAVVSAASDGHHNDDEQEPPANRRRIAAFDWDDWDDLKQLYTDAVERVENDDPEAAIVLLRGVIHECTRFLGYYQDPSSFFSAPKGRVLRSPSPRVLTPPGERMRRDWGSDRSGSPSDDRPTTSGNQGERSNIITPRTTSAEAFTFHALYGSTLFYFGNTISQNPELLKPEEPPNPETYYTSALEVFQTADNVLSQLTRTSISSENPDDWQMAIAWGRTLIALACERFGKPQDPPSSPQNAGKSPLMVTSPNLRPSIIPPYSRRSTESSIKSDYHHAHSPFVLPKPIIDYSQSQHTNTYTSLQEMFLLAKDQLLRGIFRIPLSSSTVSTPQNALASPPPFSRRLPTSPVPKDRNLDLPKSTPRDPSPKTLAPTVRSRTLFTIGIELLQAAELFEEESDKLQWAEYADGVLGRLEGPSTTSLSFYTSPPPTSPTPSTPKPLTPFDDLDPTFRASVKDARGRACLVVGTALAEPVEAKLEAGVVANVLDSDSAKSAREALLRSVGHFEALFAMINSGEVLQEKFEEAAQLLAEALLTLGNLTANEADQKTFYERAKAIGGDIDMDGDDDSDNANETGDDEDEQSST